MQCPFCASEINAGEVDCTSCGATRVTGRSAKGVIVGWVSMVGMILWGLLWFPLLFLPFTEHGVKGYPWLVLILGTIVVAGLYGYSRSTVKTRWVRPEA